MMLKDGDTYQVDRIELAVTDEPHPYHVACNDDALANWQSEVKRKPELFNGDIILQDNITVDGRVLTASCHAAPYSTLLHWLRSSRSRLVHLFGLGLIVSSDDLPIVGRMATHTYNSGKIYAPSGSLDRGDIVDDRVELDRNIERELKEETDLDCQTAFMETQFQIFVDKGVVIAAKRCRFDKSAEDLCKEINEFVKNDPEAELSEVFAVGANDSYDDDMPSYMHPVLDWHFGR